MDILKLFRSKKVEDLEQQVTDLQQQLVATSDLSKSLIGFNDGRTYYFDTSKNDSFSEHYTIYRGIDLLASLGAGLEVEIYRGDNLVPPETTLPGGFNIYSPNPYMSLNDLHYNALVWYFYRGEYMVEINDESGFMYLMPINPSNMSRKTNSKDWTFDNGGVKRTILDENLIYVKMLNPDDNARGLSPVDVVKTDLLNEKASLDYNTAFFKNFGQISGFFYDKEGKARNEDMERIVKQFKSTKVGTHKAYQALGLPRGIRYEQMGQTMAEMQFLESRKDIRDRILAILGIHKALFGVTDQVNRSVSEEAVRMLWLHNLQPKMKRIESAWNRKLFRDYFPAFTYKFDFSQIAELKQSADALDKRARLLKYLGYTTNEINERLKIGMEEINDPVLNVRVLPTGLIPFSEFSDTDENASNNTKYISSQNVDELLLEYFPDDNEEIKENSNTYKNMRYVRKMDKISRKSEKKMTSKLGKFFSKELGAVIKIVLGEQQAAEGFNTTEVLAQIMNLLNENKSNLIKLMTPLYEDASLDADTLATNFVKTTADPAANEAVVSQLANKITDISNHTYRLIRTQIKDGINAGETIDQIANRVRNVYKFNKSRARMIARTETLKVTEATTDERYKEAGVQLKQWISSGGEESREEHIANASQGPIPYDQTFQSGQMHPGEGSASQVINCRCTLVPVIR